MAELINRPEYLEQLIQNKDVDLVKIVTADAENHPCWTCFINICPITEYPRQTSFT